jgi:hypothetical protein
MSRRAQEVRIKWRAVRVCQVALRGFRSLQPGKTVEQRVLRQVCCPGPGGHRCHLFVLILTFLLFLSTKCGKPRAAVGSFPKDHFGRASGGTRRLQKSRQGCKEGAVQGG